MSTASPRWGRYITGAIFAVVLLWVPFYFPEFRLDQFIGWMCLAVAAAGLNLLTGYNGQISIGHGALYGLGAYAAAILVVDAGWPMPATVIAAAVVCFVAGVVIGLPALRIKGLYLALVTLAVAVLFPAVVEQFSNVTGGSSGLALRVPQDDCPRSLTECPVRWESPIDGLASDQWRYFVFLAITVVMFVITANIVRSRTGRSLIAIRDNETAAEASGINSSRVKILTFGTSAAIAGVGGAMLALNNGRVNPSSFTLLVSIYLLVAVVVGGAATITGPIVGTIVAGFFDDIVAPELPGRFENAAPVILGVLLIVQMLVAPNGIVGQVRDLQNRLARRRRGAAAAGEDDGHSDPARTPDAPEGVGST